MLSASLALSALLPAGALAAPATKAAAAPQAPAGRGDGSSGLTAPQLVQRMRAGGCVIVMRHARAPGGEPDARAAEPDNPHHERQLDAAGKASARELGAALRALSIPIGPIYSSPMYRALETIHLAGVGTPQVVPQLAEGKRGMAGAADQSQVQWLRGAVDRPPPPGRDTLIVTHTPNIVGAFGRGVSKIPAAGMLIFQPQPAGPARLLGRMTVDEWRMLARER